MSLVGADYVIMMLFYLVPDVILIVTDKCVYTKILNKAL
jgi:hypothetical protein